MADAKITKAPTKEVKNLSAPKRQSKNHKMKAEWDIPSSLVSKKANDRAEGLEVEWSLGIPGKDPKEIIEYSNEKKKSSTIDLNNIKIGKATYTRNSFYPVNSKRKLSYVTVKVRATNSKGKGKAAKNTRHFVLPREPKIGTPTFNTQTGVVSFNVKTNAGDDHQERYDTAYTLSVYNSTTKKTFVPTGKSGSSQSTDFNITYDVTGYQQLSYSDYIRLTLNASARGYAGYTKAKPRVLYVGYPAQVSILGVDVATKSASEKCTVRIKTNSSTAHPVDTVKLEYLANVEYATKEQIPGDAGWTSSDIVDNGSCTALSVSVSELLPEAGNHTYIRVKSIHLNEEVLYRYSEVVEVSKLFAPAPTASDDKIVILGVTAGNDGESAVVQLGWNADGQDDSTGTELSWSDAEDTWRSTEEPNIHTFTWSDGAITVDGVTYQDSAAIVVKGLEEGTKYYFRARRYLESEDGISYSDYAATTEPFLTTERPEAVVATCDRYVPQGKPLSVRWTFSGYSLQKTWQIVDYNNPEIVVDHGEGSFGSAQISAKRLADVSTNNELTFVVGVSTGSEPVWSSPVAVSIIDAPTANISSTSLTHVHEEETESYEGEIATFEADEERDIDSLSVSLEPVQDLHGYDAPWVGGAGKNKAKVTDGTFTKNGVTFTYANDEIRLNGTCTGNTWIAQQVAQPITLPAGTYTMSVEVTGVTGSRNLVAYGINNASIGYLYVQNNGAKQTKTFTIESEITANSDGYIYGGNVYNNAQIKFQVESGSTATSYAPYSNICPISGWDGVNVYVSPDTTTASATTYPVNLSDTAGTVYGGTVDVVSGELTVTDANIASYNGETLPLTWISDRDVYASGTTPTTGAQVVYKLATPQTYQLTPTQIQTLLGTNNVWSDAGAVTVDFINVTVDEDRLTQNNLLFTVTASRICDLIVIITSQGATGQMPQGVMTQTAGDTVHSDVYSPDWTENNSTFTATVSVPTDLDFWDLGTYTLSVTAVDRTTQLQSETVVKEFAVYWQNQAVSPEDAVTLTVINQTDEDGDHTQAVQIDLTPPTGSRESDVYDIYRMDVETPRLIGEGFPLTYTVTDMYAPFGDEVPLKYRIALRTEDGDVEFADIEYEAQCKNLRFDWQGGSLELPFGISYGDSFKKDVEIRQHLNGSSDGYWNQNIERRGSLASDVIKIVQPKAVESARALARYPGAVFVRRPDGSAFEADVQVTDLSKKNDAVVAMTFDATEIGLTQEFLLPTPFVVEEEEEE